MEASWSNFWFLLCFVLLNGGFCNARAPLSYRSDGPNVEYKSLRDLETTPFVLGDGSWYRDRLTIEASKAVGQFAQTFDFRPLTPHVRSKNNSFEKQNMQSCILSIFLQNGSGGFLGTFRAEFFFAS